MADGGDDRDEDVSSLSAPSESRSVRFDSGGSEESQASESSMVSSIAGTSIVSADVDELQTEVTALRERVGRIEAEAGRRADDRLALEAVIGYLQTRMKSNDRAVASLSSRFAVETAVFRDSLEKITRALQLPQGATDCAAAKGNDGVWSAWTRDLAARASFDDLVATRMSFS